MCVLARVFCLSVSPILVKPLEAERNVIGHYKHKRETRAVMNLGKMNPNGPGITRVPYNKLLEI